MIVFKLKLKLKRRHQANCGSNFSFEFHINEPIWRFWEMKDRIDGILIPLMIL